MWIPFFVWEYVIYKIHMCVYVYHIYLNSCLNSRAMEETQRKPYKQLAKFHTYSTSNPIVLLLSAQKSVVIFFCRRTLKHKHVRCTYDANVPLWYDTASLRSCLMCGRGNCTVHISFVCVCVIWSIHSWYHRPICGLLLPPKSGHWRSRVDHMPPSHTAQWPPPPTLHPTENNCAPTYSFYVTASHGWQPHDTLWHIRKHTHTCWTIASAQRKPCWARVKCKNSIMPNTNTFDRKACSAAHSLMSVVCVWCCVTIRFTGQENRFRHAQAPARRTHTARTTIRQIAMRACGGLEE